MAFWPVLAGLVRVWLNDGDMSHGALAPLIAGWVAWQRRDRLRAAATQPSGLGLAFLITATIGAAVAVPTGWDSFARGSLMLSLIGIILYLGGWPVLRVLAFPLALLSFMIPPPTVVYDQITFPLQLLASRLAEHSLELLGFSVLREGNILELAGQKLSVAEACSGIRSLFSLCFFGVVYAYLFDGRAWMRWALLAAAVPIAILANAGRIVFTGVAGEHNAAWVHGALHEFSGWAVFLVSVGALMALHSAMRPVSRYRHELVHG